MNTIRHFQSLSIKQKADLLTREGKFVATRYEPAYVVDCYSWKDTQVEIYFHKQGDAPVVFRFLNEDAHNFLPEENIHYLYQDVICRHSA